MADAAEAMAADFVAYGLDPAFVTQLRDQITAFEQAEETQDTGEQTQAGATAEFGPFLKEAMMKAKQLDAFVHNFYASDAEKMGEWKTASHVQRQPKKKATPPPGP
ncbi:MAG: hypothetical protein ABI946_12435 [Chthoniobacterales bacterium]